MAAPEGNEYYLIRTTNGRPKKYSPSSLLKKANEYFQWVLDNPLMESKVVQGTNTQIVDGEIITRSHHVIQIPKMRPFTLLGFCNYASICLDTFKNYEKLHLSEHEDEKEQKKAKDFFVVTKKIREIVENHQFEGAAAGFLNHNIIAQKLGLASKIQHEGNKDKPIEMSPRTVIIQEYNG